MEIVKTRFDFEPLHEEICYTISAYMGGVGCPLLPSQSLGMDEYFRFLSQRTKGRIKTAYDLFLPSTYDIIRASVKNDYLILSGLKPPIPITDESDYHQLCISTMSPLPKKIRYVITAYTGCSMLNDNEKLDYQTFLSEITNKKITTDTEQIIAERLAKALLKNDYYSLFADRSKLESIFVDQQDHLKQLQVFNLNRQSIAKSRTANSWIKLALKSKEHK